jgi:hypothetical protein
MKSIEKKGVIGLLFLNGEGESVKSEEESGTEGDGWG